MNKKKPTKIKPVNNSVDKNLNYLAGFFDTLIQVDLAHKRKLPEVSKEKSSYNINAKDKNNGKK